mgnify:CR=1 FL=1
MTNNTIKITPRQLANLIGNSTNLNMSPEQLSQIMGNDTNLNMSPAELSKMLGNNATLDLSMDKLQRFLDNKTIGDFNASISFSPDELSNLTRSLNKINDENNTSINQTSLNGILLHVICTVKSDELSKLFESMAIPLSSCQIRE